MHESQTCCVSKRLSWRSCQSPVAHSCSLLNHQSSFCGGMFKPNTKFNADLLLYSLCHFECEGHTVQHLTQWHLPLSLTSRMKSLLFMHAHSSSLSLADKLHQCHANQSHYINNGLTFSRQTSYMSMFRRYGQWSKKITFSQRFSGSVISFGHYQVHANTKMTDITKKTW